jgi:hypothetical protein
VWFNKHSEVSALGLIHINLRPLAVLSCSILIIRAAWGLWNLDPKKIKSVHPWLKDMGKWFSHFSINLDAIPLNMKIEATCSSKLRHLPRALRGVKTQRATLWTITFMETWKLVMIINIWFSFPHAHCNGRPDIVHRHDLLEFCWKIITKWIFKSSTVIKVKTTRAFIVTTNISLLVQPLEEPYHCSAAFLMWNKLVLWSSFT